MLLEVYIAGQRTYQDLLIIHKIHQTAMKANAILQTCQPAQHSDKDHVPISEGCQVFWLYQLKL